MRKISKPGRIYMKKRLGAIALAFAMILVLGAYAVYGDSDITSDPLVSLSYINEVLWPEIEDMIERAISGDDFERTETDTEEDTEESESETETETEVPEEPTAGVKSFEYEVLHLMENTLLLSETPCEIILRSGHAAAYLGGNDNGLADLTDGGELMEGDSLVSNHLLMIPRGDGRGVRITSSEAYIMVRGGYRIVEEQ